MGAAPTPHARRVFPAKGGEEVGTVTVSGGVMRAGSFGLPAEGGFKVSDAILAAGGFKHFADAHKVMLTRPRPGRPEKKILVDARVLKSGGQMERDMLLQDGDRLFVPDLIIKFE